MVKVKTLLRDEIEGQAIALALAFYVWNYGIFSWLIGKETRLYIAIPIHSVLIFSAIAVAGCWGTRLKEKCGAFTSNIYPMISQVVHAATGKWKLALFTIMTIRMTAYALPEAASRTSQPIEGMAILGYIYICVIFSAVWMAVFNVINRFLFPQPDKTDPNAELSKIKSILEHLDGLIAQKGFKMTIDQTRTVKLVPVESCEPNSLHPLYYRELELIVRRDEQGKETILYQKPGYKDVYI